MCFSQNTKVPTFGWFRFQWKLCWRGGCSPSGRQGVCMNTTISNTLMMRLTRCWSHSRHWWTRGWQGVDLIPITREWNPSAFLSSVAGMRSTPCRPHSEVAWVLIRLHQLMDGRLLGCWSPSTNWWMVGSTHLLHINVDQFNTIVRYPLWFLWKTPSHNESYGGERPLFRI